MTNEKITDLFSMGTCRYIDGELEKYFSIEQEINANMSEVHPEIISIVPIGYAPKVKVSSSIDINLLIIQQKVTFD